MPEYKTPRRRKPPSMPAMPTVRTQPSKSVRVTQPRGLQQKPHIKTQKPSSAGRRRKQNMAIYYMMFLFVSAVIFSVLSTTVLFNLETVYAEGESIYTEEQILAAADIKEGVNLIRFNSEESKNRIIESLVYIDNVNIKQKLPNKLEIQVTGAEEMAAIEHRGRIFVISRSGRILKEAEYYKKNENFMIYGYQAEKMQVGDYISSQDERQTELIFNIILTAEKVKLEGIIDINITDSLDIKLNYMNRIELHIGPATDLELKLRVAANMLSEEIEIGETGTLRLIDPLRIAFRPDDL